MAIWHFKTYFLPAAELKKKCGCIPDTLSFDFFNDGHWWLNCQHKQSVSAILNDIFGRSESPGEGMRAWHSGSHSVTIYFDADGNTDLVSAETDARLPCDKFF